METITRAEVKDIDLWTTRDACTHAVRMQADDGSWDWCPATASDAATYARHHGRDMTARVIDGPSAMAPCTDLDGHHARTTPLRCDACGQAMREGRRLAVAGKLGPLWAPAAIRDYYGPARAIGAELRVSHVDGRARTLATTWEAYTDPANARVAREWALRDVMPVYALGDTLPRP